MLCAIACNHSILNNMRNIPGEGSTRDTSSNLAEGSESDGADEHGKEEDDLHVRTAFYLWREVVWERRRQQTNPVTVPIILLQHWSTSLPSLNLRKGDCDKNKK